MNRRNILKGAVAGAASLALPAIAIPAKLAAQVRAGGARDRLLFDIAKREMERAGEVLWARDIVGIADFGLRSSEPRFHFVNLERQEVRSHLVSHGTGSDPEHDGWLNDYSNVEGSNATSRGAYISWEWYTGRYGTSVRLGGLDPTNNQAFPRAIVMHQAQYAEAAHVERWGRLGRSNGCFAMGSADFQDALINLSGGRLLYAESLGIGADGEKVVKPEPIPPIGHEPPENLELLVPEGATGIERINPGVY